MIQERLFDWWSVIIILGIIQGLFVTLALFSSKRGRPGTSFLAILVLILVWHHLQSISIYLGFYRTFPHFYGADLGSLFLIGPLFYFYVNSLTVSGQAWKRVNWLHFIPFLATIIVHPAIFQGSVDKVETIIAWLIATRYDNPELRKAFFLDDTIFIAESIHMMIYLSLALITLKDYSRKIKQYSSNLHKVNLQWLKHITVAIILVVLVSFILQKTLYVILRYYYYSLDYIYILPMTILIYLIGFYALRRPGIFLGEMSFEISTKYSGSSLSLENANNYQKMLLQYMEESRPYLNPELKLSELATSLDIHPNHLSQVINERFQQNFFDFINGYRVEEAKKRLSDPVSNRDTLLKIALDCGFNNKVSFNNYFKKLTDQTPSSFRKEFTQMS